MEIIKVKDLVKTFEKKGKGDSKRIVNAVKGISFNVQEGEILAFIGPNGAGKSTTIKILTGILYSDSGQASVCGFNPNKERSKLARNIGCLFGQKSQLNQFLPVIDSYMLLGAIYDIPKDILIDRINEYAEYFKIKELLNSPAGSLSLGQRMICEIVGTILHNPKILFLDEPTIGLDIVMKQKVREMILQLNKRYGTTVILTSHDIGDVEYLCNRIIIINYGEIVLDNDISKIRSTLLSKKIVTVTFANEVTSEIFNHATNATVKEINGNRCRLEFDTNIVTLASVLSTLSDYGTIIDVDITSNTLESIIYENFKSMKGV